eukprot:07979.XXX_212408_212554_1 [CDS] Oithona nana genome sequencing.
MVCHINVYYKQKDKEPNGECNQNRGNVFQECQNSDCIGRSGLQLMMQD